MCTLTWTEFLEEANDFLKISEKLNDSWSLYKKNDHEGNSFLIYKQKISISKSNEKETAIAANETDKNNSNDILQIEYHVVYSISYQVPVLYFRVQRNDGSILDLENSWRLFRSYDEDLTVRTRADMLSILTLMDHPVLFKPFLAIHPCRTSDILADLGESKNRILTFISLMGPYLQLNLCNEYGLEFK